MFKRTSLLLLFITIASVSLMGAASTQYASPSIANDAQIVELNKMIATHQYDKTSRNQSLRYNRAVQYHAKALEMKNANWNQQAADFARRGITLLKLNQQ